MNPMIQLLIPMLVPALASFIVAVVRTNVAPLIPNKFMPLAMMLGGAVLAATASALGVSLPEVGIVIDANWLAAALDGVLAGAVSVGYHQLARKIAQWVPEGGAIR